MFSHNIAYIPPSFAKQGDGTPGAEKNNVPKIIQPGDIKGIIHTHSNWATALHTIEELGSNERKDLNT